jgi:hypothetical protein
MPSWVSLMVQGASSDSAGNLWSGFGGHALLAIHLSEDVYEVFHLVGARGASSGGSGHAIYNGNTSIERYRCDEAGKAISCDGISGKSSEVGGYFSFMDKVAGDYTEWYKAPANKKLNVRESPRLNISDKCAEKIIEKCMGLCKKKNVSETVGNFSLIGGQVCMGTNCITWAYHTLKSCGVTFDWKLYAMSFVSPRKAIESGGGLQLAG